MANVFGILTAIVLALAGFIAHKNKAAYQDEIANKATEKSNLARSESRFKLAQDNLAATITKRTGVDTEVVGLTDDEKAQKTANVDLESDIETKTQTKATNKTKLDGIREQTAKIGDIQELASRMRATNAKLEELSQGITASEAKLANLTAQNTTTKSQADGMKNKFEIMSRGESLPELNTRIRSIYPTWGFVTLASGNSNGVVANSKLDVVRSGAVVAQLLVTAVERNSASASIIPDSIGQDVTLMVGDRVIPASKEDTTAKN